MSTTVTIEHFPIKPNPQVFGNNPSIKNIQHHFERHMSSFVRDCCNIMEQNGEFFLVFKDNVVATSFVEDVIRELYDTGIMDPDVFVCVSCNDNLNILLHKRNWHWVSSFFVAKTASGERLLLPLEYWERGYAPLAKMADVELRIPVQRLYYKGDFTLDHIQVQPKNGQDITVMISGGEFLKMMMGFEKVKEWTRDAHTNYAELRFDYAPVDWVEELVVSDAFGEFEPSINTEYTIVDNKGNVVFGMESAGGDRIEVKTTLQEIENTIRQKMSLKKQQTIQHTMSMSTPGM